MKPLPEDPNHSTIIDFGWLPKSTNLERNLCLQSIISREEGYGGTGVYFREDDLTANIRQPKWVILKVVDVYIFLSAFSFLEHVETNRTSARREGFLI